MYKNTVVKHIKATNPHNKLYYGTVDTPEYGKIFTAYYLKDKLLYICRFQFAFNLTIEIFANDLQTVWPNTVLVMDEEQTKSVFAEYVRERTGTQEACVVLIGTDFQLKVWSALLEIPFGEERTYGEIAATIGCPKAARAVGNAVGSNNIVIFIPCHRVRASAKDAYKYGPGSDMKKKILLHERMNK